MSISSSFNKIPPPTKQPTHDIMHNLLIYLNQTIISNYYIHSCKSLCPINNYEIYFNYYKKNNKLDIIKV